jgi:4'-phosphopantetheinyl transferase
MERGALPLLLPPGEVHVWMTDPGEVREAELLGRYHALMNADERRKHDRYRTGAHRHACLVTRALVRTTLSRYCLEIDPAAWQFVEVANGRPEIARGQGSLPLRFNLSRTAGLIACAVTLERAVGVDVEWLDPHRSTDAIAGRFFAPPEVRDLRAHPPERHLERFYSYWTLKEAYIKARGLGLAIPLDRFAFGLPAGESISISFDARLDDDPAAWQFALDRPTPQHVLATAIERRGGPDLAVRIRTVMP